VVSQPERVREGDRDGAGSTNRSGLVKRWHHNTPAGPVVAVGKPPSRFR
jgi:hypothetical protein